MTAEKRFEKAARDFCAWAEMDPVEDDALRALELLTKVYALGLELPFPAPIKDELGPSVGEEESERVFKRFSKIPPGYYSTAEEPLEVPGKTLVGDVHNDLRDVYVDLREGLMLWDAGDLQDAVWTWRNSFRSHWGNHATEAIHVLHRALLGP